jgi:hypothetical protein
LEFGAALFTTGLIVVAFEYLDREDAEARAMQRFRTVLREQAAAIRDAVIKGFAFSPDALTDVASPATLDKIVRNCLAIRLGDKDLAGDVPPTWFRLAIKDRACLYLRSRYALWQAQHRRLPCGTFSCSQPTQTTALSPW